MIVKGDMYWGPQQVLLTVVVVFELNTLKTSMSGLIFVCPRLNGLENRKSSFR